METNKTMRIPLSASGLNTLSSQPSPSGWASASSEYLPAKTIRGTFRAVNETSPEPGSQGVQSPFAGVQSSLRTRGAGGSGKTIVIVLIIALAAIVIGIFAFRALSNPLRTLKPFPTEEYYNHYQSLEGTRFKATLRAAGQIGWKKDLGRLVNFKVEPDGKPIVALLPPQFDSQTFEAGETFDAEIRVEEGGLVKINYLAPR